VAQRLAVGGSDSSVRHWLLVWCAAGMALCAALSKEIGITAVGTMMLYDVLLAPHMQPRCITPGRGSDRSSKHGSQRTQHATAAAAAARRQLLRLLLLVATALLYVRLRQWVAVEQLVAIYRKVRVRPGGPACACGGCGAAVHPAMAATHSPA
jgi:hypothetical protein